MKGIVASILLGGAAMAALPLSAQLTWGSKDIHYPKDFQVAKNIVTDTVIPAWRGERVGALALIQVPKGEKVEVKAQLKGKLKGTASFVDYVLTDDFRQCGTHPTDLPAWEAPDIIDNVAKSVTLDGETRPIWVTIEVPRNAKPGKYTETLEVNGQKIALNVEVSAMTLPKPEDQSFYLNLWQQPYSVSRYGKVKPWSKEHFELLKPYAEMLYRAGQRTISAILFFEPWGEQSNDLFEPMVETVKKKDGSWSYDYTVFDKWVEFMDKNGVNGDIECYSMIPWEMKFRYFDEASGEYKFVQTTTKTAEYRDLWGSFLKAFASHLKKKGWFDRTLIAMDERGLEDMMNAYAIIQEADPNFKVMLAGNYHPELTDKLYSYTIDLGKSFPAGELEARKAKGQVTCLYTCCSRPDPNIFSNSAPADATWLPVYCTAVGYDGYLHWSFMNWTDDPMKDSRFKLFAPGDTYFIYPEGRSSVRYERMVEGIELSEKVKALQEKLLKAGDVKGYQKLDAALNPIRIGYSTKNAVSTAKQVNYLEKVVAELSK